MTDTPNLRSFDILKDERGYFFMVVEEWNGPRRYGSPVAVVSCERGHIAVINDRLMHFIDGQRHYYEAEWIAKQSEPPAGLKIKPDSP